MVLFLLEIIYVRFELRLFELLMRFVVSWCLSGVVWLLMVMGLLRFMMVVVMDLSFLVGFCSVVMRMLLMVVGSSSMLRMVS